MRRAARGALRTAALGGWAALALLAMPAAQGAAWAGDGREHGATEGPARPHLQHDDHRPTGHRGDRPDDDGGAGAVPDAAAAAPGPAKEDPPPAPAGGGAPEPRIEIGTALGPVTGQTTPAGAVGEAARIAPVEQAAPLLSFDAPSPFGPRSIAGGLYGAPRQASVQVAIRRGSPARGCAWWSARVGRFGAARRQACASERWLTARLRPAGGGLRWRLALGATLPDGSYRYVVRVLDAGGRTLAVRHV